MKYITYYFLPGVVLLSVTVNASFTTVFSRAIGQVTGSGEVAVRSEIGRYSDDIEMQRAGLQSVVPQTSRCVTVISNATENVLTGLVGYATIWCSAPERFNGDGHFWRITTYYGGMVITFSVLHAISKMRKGKDDHIS